MTWFFEHNSSKADLWENSCSDSDKNIAWAEFEIDESNVSDLEIYDN